jgi:hypothetical protein
LALAELSIYPKQDSTVLSTYITVDASNVNDFQLPLEIAIEDNSRTPYAYLGSPVTSPSISRQSIVTGAPSGGISGGKNSPFYAWLAAQPSPQSGPLPVMFQNLALPQNLALQLQPPPYPAMIISPDHYLQLQCYGPTSVPPTPAYVPNAPNCSKPEDQGQLVHLNDPLNSYYDSELTTFFTTALSRTPLVVMGDGQDPPPDGSVDGSKLYEVSSLSDNVIIRPIIAVPECHSPKTSYLR